VRGGSLTSPSAGRGDNGTGLSTIGQQW